MLSCVCCVQAVCICVPVSGFLIQRQDRFWLSFGPEAAWQHTRVPGMLCGGWDDCCECLCNEVVLFPIVLLIRKLVSRPTSAAGAPADRWAAVGSSTSPPPTPFLTHSSDRYVFSLRSLLHPELGVLCVSQNGSYTADVDEPSS